MKLYHGVDCTTPVCSPLHPTSTRGCDMGRWWVKQKIGERVGHGNKHHDGVEESLLLEHTTFMASTILAVCDMLLVGTNSCALPSFYRLERFLLFPANN